MGETRAKAERLFGRLPASGCWLDLPCAHVAEIAGRAGADFGVIDLEHGPASVETAALMAMALRAEGAAALARPPEVTEGWVKRLLDSGADGLILPMIESGEAARAAVALTRYPPDGRRGLAAGVIRASGWGRKAEAYRAGWNARGFVAAQIETPAALAVAREIAAVEGVDMLFFGPSDFSSFAGFEGGAGDDRTLAAFHEMRAAAASAGKLSGAVAFPAAQAGLAAEGCDLIAAASDVAALSAGIARAVDAGRGGAS